MESQGGKTKGWEGSAGAKEREKEYLYWLCKLALLGAVSIRKLYEYFRSFEAIYNMEERGLRKTGILNSRQLAALGSWHSHFSQCRQEYRGLGERKVRFVTPLDEDYPQRLREIYDYPMGLWVKGRLPEDCIPSVAIVGARGCSAYGGQLAREFARILAKGQVQVVSGLAMGIDGAAHEGALEAQGLTFAVLGCGVDICYPASHYGIFNAMEGSGGILSEFPLGRGPLPHHFPMRNRLISGLADAVLVVEAKAKSGSLITAEQGLEQGREVFAVPGRITDPLSIGCNRLIQQGAHMATSPGDILEYLGVKCRKVLILNEKNVNGLAKKEKMVYSCLDFTPKHLDEIIRSCGLGPGECMGTLLELELGGYVFRSANHYFGKKL
ncbi:MAG: DNA-protecting protein DprA [Lachnospiraceae bacterium]|nr:DNA-protecting protein DprA [Lachnospiraceae bacterium]